MTRITSYMTTSGARRIGRFEYAPSRQLVPGDLGLSEREIETLNLILEELPLRQIAERMELSLHTVDTFKRRLFEKLGVNTLAGAAVIATAYLAGMALQPLDNAA